MFPELPDAKMDTRKPIGFSPTSPCNFGVKQISKMMAERACAVNGQSEETHSGLFQEKQRTLPLVILVNRRR